MGSLTFNSFILIKTSTQNQSLNDIPPFVAGASGDVNVESVHQGMHSSVGSRGHHCTAVATAPYLAGCEITNEILLRDS